MNLIIGNVLSLFAMFSDSFSSSRKTSQGVLWVQSLSQVFYALSTIILGGYSASVQNVVSILRNLFAIRGFNPKWLQWTLVALGVGFGLSFNNLGWVGLLPVIANLFYTLAVFRCADNERALKAAFLFAVILFTIFNAFIWNIVGIFSNAAVAVSLVIFLTKKKAPDQEKEAETP